MEVTSVITAAVANFVLGGFWYIIFGKQWQFAWKISEKNLTRRDPKPYLIAFIGSLWASYGLFLMIKHIRPQSLEETLTMAIGTWLFILVGFGAKHYSFAKINGKAFAIDYGLDLVGLILMCLIITA
jgi:hypothetical protein